MENERKQETVLRYIVREKAREITRYREKTRKGMENERERATEWIRVREVDGNRQNYGNIYYYINERKIVSIWFYLKPKAYSQGFLSEDEMLLKYCAHFAS